MQRLSGGHARLPKPTHSVPALQTTGLKVRYSPSCLDFATPLLPPPPVSAHPPVQSLVAACYATPSTATLMRSTTGDVPEPQRRRARTSPPRLAAEPSLPLCLWPTTPLATSPCQPLSACPARSVLAGLSSAAHTHPHPRPAAAVGYSYSYNCAAKGPPTPLRPLHINVPWCSLQALHANANRCPPQPTTWPARTWIRQPEPSVSATWAPLQRPRMALMSTQTPRSFSRLQPPTARCPLPTARTNAARRPVPNFTRWY